MKTTKKEAQEAAAEDLQAEATSGSAAEVSAASTDGVSASQEKASHENEQVEMTAIETVVAEKTAKTPVQTSVGQSKDQSQSQPPKSVKKERQTPAKPVATMPSKAKVSNRSMDELHERRIVKEPTLFERAKAKQEKAKTLLNAQPAGETSSTLIVSSATKKAPLRKPSEQTPGRPRAKPTATIVKPVPTAKTPLKLTAGRAVTPSSSSGESKPKRSVTYKPYTGPVPPYQGDSLFTPKKPRAVASKSTTPSRTPRPLSAIKSRQHNSASKKQGSSTPTPAKGKENALPQENETSESHKDAGVEKVKPSPKAAMRVPIKESSSKKMTECASKTRRDKYLQDGQSKAYLARHAARSGLEANDA